MLGTKAAVALVESANAIIDFNDVRKRTRMLLIMTAMARGIGYEFMCGWMRLDDGLICL